MDTATVEHLKHFVGIVIDNYKEGQGPHGGLADSGLAKSLIWQEVQRCAALEDNPDSEPTVWLRLSTSLTTDRALRALSNACQKLSGTVLTLQWLGPRANGEELVGYAVVTAASIRSVSTLVAELEQENIRTRDGFYRG